MLITEQQPYAHTYIGTYIKYRYIHNPKRFEAGVGVLQNSNFGGRQAQAITKAETNKSHIPQMRLPKHKAVGVTILQKGKSASRISGLGSLFPTFIALSFGNSASRLSGLGAIFPTFIVLDLGNSASRPSGLGT